MVGHCFSIIFDNSWKNNGQRPPNFSQAFVTFCSEAIQPLLSRQCVRPVHVAKSEPLAQLKLLRVQTMELGCSCQEFKPCYREIATDEIQEKKNIERAAI